MGFYADIVEQRRTMRASQHGSNEAQRPHGSR